MSQLFNLIRMNCPHRQFRDDEVTTCCRDCFRCAAEAANKIDEKELRKLRYLKRRVLPALLEKANGRLRNRNSHHIG